MALPDFYDTAADVAGGVGNIFDDPKVDYTLDEMVAAGFKTIFSLSAYGGLSNINIFIFGLLKVEHSYGKVSSSGSECITKSDLIRLLTT